MIDFDLYNDVIIDFSKDETFSRLTTSINNIGREEQTLDFTYDVFCHIHPASDKDLVTVTNEGYHVEDMVKIFAPVSSDILQNDTVSYSGNNYRVMKTNIKLVGDYRKHFAELLKA